MKSKHIFTLLFIMLVGSAYTTDMRRNDAMRSQINNAFTYGEELTYKVHYGWINAASVKIKVADKPTMVNGRETFRISAFGKTFKSFDWAFRVRDHFVSYVDARSIAPLKYYKKVEEDNYRDEDLVYYDHENGKLKGSQENMDMPAYVQDIISGSFYARTIDFESASIGQSFPINIYLDQEIYDLKFKYLGKEVIKTDLGKVECYKLRPQLVVDRVFKDEDDMTIWISADENKVPMRVQAAIYVGSVKVSITKAKGLRNPFSSKR